MAQTTLQASAHALTRPTGWLTIGMALTVVQPARADFCPDAKGYETMSEGWIMANVCGLVHDAVSGAAKDVLTDLGKGAFKAVLNSYVPGLGQLIFGEEDKFARHAQEIIDQVKRSEQNVIQTTIAHLDDLMRAMVDQNKMERRAGFMALLHEWEMWNAKDWRGKADQHGQIASISSAINVLRWELQGQIATAGTVSFSTLPYPYLSLLHEWTLLMALQFQAESQEIQWAAVSKAYPQGSASLTPDDLAATLHANPDIQASADRELKASWSTLLGEAQNFMDQLSAVGGPGHSIFLEDLKWSWPLITPADPALLGERTSALPNTIPCEGCTAEAGWYYGGIKAFEWKDRYWSNFKFVNDRWCGWLPIHDSQLYNGIWSEARDAPLCSSQPAQYTYNPVNPSPLTARDGSLYDAVLRVYDHISTHNPEYGTMLLAGYGPLRVALDQWWEGAWMLGAVQGYRPVNQLDLQLDELLWSADPIVSRFAYNGDIRANFGQAVDAVYQLANQRPASQEERSVFVGFALKHGTAALGQIAWTAALNDPNHYVANPDGSKSYPMYLHTYYIRHRQHSPEEMAKFYGDQAPGILAEPTGPDQVRFAEAIFNSPL